jgi:hypothetical protein
MSEEDILHIHDNICKYLNNEKNNSHLYIRLITILIYQVLNSVTPYGIQNEKDLVVQIETSYEYDIKMKTEEYTYREYKNMCEFIIELDKYIISIDINETNYMNEVDTIIQKYKECIERPKVSSFIGKKNNSEDKEIASLTNKYSNIINNLKESSFPINSSKLEYYFNKFMKSEYKKQYKNFNPFDNNLKKATSKKKKEYCECFDKFEDSNGHIVCKNCGIVYSDNEDNINYHDFSRVNMVQKYHYDKKCHFRDTINQYQGKQNKFIPQKVYDDLEYMIKMHGLNKDKLTINHISMFLTETKNTNYYEDKQLIYSVITGKNKPDISKYEKQLYEDFDKLVIVFLQLKINRKNFLNAHYVLKQLLLRQGVKLPENHLNSLRTPQRLREHDEIYEKCCEVLGWNFRPLS